MGVKVIGKMNKGWIGVINGIATGIFVEKYLCAENEVRKNQRSYN